mmetsp:Transcript_21812/g.28580  ORF Transcript_21812/g.28580 Transcript_21812/m.28580 type:complete len:821 (+) Transcript_21812:62-2524(+)
MNNPNPESDSFPISDVEFFGFDDALELHSAPSSHESSFNQNENSKPPSSEPISTSPENPMMPEMQASSDLATTSAFHTSSQIPASSEIAPSDNPDLAENSFDSKNDGLLAKSDSSTEKKLEALKDNPRRGNPIPASQRIKLQDLEKYYHYPLTEVAKVFDISTTVLKRVCRKFGIQRWPHRQIRSITSTIEQLKEQAAFLDPPQSLELLQQVELLEKKKKLVTRTSSCGLNATLRNAIFMARPGEVDEEILFHNLLPNLQAAISSNEKKPSKAKSTLENTVEPLQATQQGNPSSQETAMSENQQLSKDDCSLAILSELAQQLKTAIFTDKQGEGLPNDLQESGKSEQKKMSSSKVHTDQFQQNDGGTGGSIQFSASSDFGNEKALISEMMGQRGESIQKMEQTNSTSPAKFKDMDPVQSTAFSENQQQSLQPEMMELTNQLSSTKQNFPNHLQSSTNLPILSVATLNQNVATPSNAIDSNAMIPEGMSPELFNLQSLLAQQVEPSESQTILPITSLPMAGLKNEQSTNNSTQASGFVGNLPQNTGAANIANINPVQLQGLISNQSNLEQPTKRAKTEPQPNANIFMNPPLKEVRNLPPLWNNLQQSSLPQLNSNTRVSLPNSFPFGFNMPAGTEQQASVNSLRNQPEQLQAGSGSIISANLNHTDQVQVVLGPGNVLYAVPLYPNQPSGAVQNSTYVLPLSGSNNSTPIPTNQLADVLQQSIGQNVPQSAANSGIPLAMVQPIALQPAHQQPQIIQQQPSLSKQHQAPQVKGPEQHSGLNNIENLLKSMSADQMRDLLYRALASNPQQGDGFYQPRNPPP